MTTRFDLDTPVDVFHRHVDCDGFTRQMDSLSGTSQTPGAGEHGPFPARRALRVLAPQPYNKQAPSLWRSTFQRDGVVTFMSNVNRRLVTATTVIAVDHPQRQRVLDALGVNDTRLAESIIDRARNRDGPDLADALN